MLARPTCLMIITCRVSDRLSTAMYSRTRYLSDCMTYHASLYAPTRPAPGVTGAAIMSSWLCTVRVLQPKIAVSVKHRKSVKIFNHRTAFCSIHWTDFDQTHGTSSPYGCERQPQVSSPAPLVSSEQVCKASFCNTRSKFAIKSPLDLGSCLSPLLQAEVLEIELSI